MVTGAYFPELSGGGLQARALIHALADRARFTVLTTSIDPALPSRADDDGVPVHRIYVDSRSRWARAQATLRLIATLVSLRHDADVVNLHGFSKKAVMVAVFCRVFRKRYVLTLQTGGHDEPAAARAMGRLTAWAYAAADRVLSVSPGLSAAYLAAGFPADRLRQVCNAVDVERFRPPHGDERRKLRAELGLPADLRLILFVGYFGRDKRPDWLYEAWAALTGDVRDACGVVFIGRTNAAAYREVDPSLAESIRGRAAAEGIGGRLWFIESTLEIERYYRACDLYVLPSIREGLPIALLEAMATGLPSIATDIAGSTDTLIADGHNGRLVSPGDQRALTAALASLLTDDALARRLGAAARATVLSRYAIDKTAPLWLAEYRAVPNPEH
jgi:glycosyltransferase involved in cell wall biosynthesis